MEGGPVALYCSDWVRRCTLSFATASVGDILFKVFGCEQTAAFFPCPSLSRLPLYSLLVPAASTPRTLITARVPCSCGARTRVRLGNEWKSPGPARGPTKSDTTLPLFFFLFFGIILSSACG